MTSSMQRAMMDNYNYWNDSRTQASMFSSVWRIVHQEQYQAIIALDEEWLMDDGWLSDKLYEIVDKWIADEEDFTAEHRKLKAESDECAKRAKDQLKAAFDAEGKKYYPGMQAWSLSQITKEERTKIRDLQQQAHEKERAAYPSLSKLFDKARDEHLDRICQELGIKQFRDRSGREHSFCVQLRTKFEVCGQCSGSGKVVNPQIDAGGLTYEDFHEDPDFEERYFSGAYDITCPSCSGDRVEAIPQFPEWLQKLIEERDKEEWDHISETCAERAMGA
jgi:hypothetical protein